MPSPKRPVLDGAMLWQRLASLRRRMRLVATVRGAGFLLTVLLATAAVAGLIDWRWHLPPLVRAVVLVGTLAGGIFVAYRYLFRPLSAPSDDLSLALRIEEAYPALNDALASTVQFLERGTRADSSSAALEHEAVKRALANAAGCDFGKVVNKRGLLWAGMSGGVSTTLATTLILLAPALSLTSLLRLANPFGEHDWPKKTQLEIDPPRLRIGRNEAFEVKGRVRGVIPPQATIDFRFEGFPNLEHHCDIKTDEAGTGHLASHLEPGRVQRSFRFQVRANDAVSPEYHVEVLPPPSLVALDSKPSPQLQLYYPAYTGLPTPDQLSPGTGNIDAVASTAARLRARRSAAETRLDRVSAGRVERRAVGIPRSRGRTDSLGARTRCRWPDLVGERARRVRCGCVYVHHRFHTGRQRHVRAALRGRDAACATTASLSYDCTPTRRRPCISNALRRRATFSPSCPPPS